MSVNAHHVTAAVVATVGAIGGAYYAYCLYQESRKVKIPETWRQVGTLKDLCIYPIKSCGPVMMNRAECTLLGLKDGWLRDRIMMVVDSQYKFITARVHPELLLVEPSVKNAVLTLKQADMDPVYINLAEVVAAQVSKKSHVWGVPVPVYDCGGEASKWFSKLMDQSADNFRLVYYGSQHCRPLMSSANKYYKFTKNDTGAFPDEVSFHLINEASVDELNTRLKDTKVSPRNFRPNFVLSGAKPYDEDNWKFVKIGDNVFEIIKPCLRCVLTTIDPETGIRNSKVEPLETLKSYRQLEDPVARRAEGTAPRMGVQMALRSGPGGFVSLNDPIFVA